MVKIKWDNIQIGRCYFLILYCLMTLAAKSQVISTPPPDHSENTLSGLLKQLPDSFQHIIANPNKFRLQIIYTQINRNKNNQPFFRTFSYPENPLYTYPASTVKLPAAVLALEKINSLSKYGVDANSTMITLPVRQGEKKLVSDSSSESGHPSVAQYIKKILLVSDNDAFNRLYELLGQEDFNNRLHQLGFNDAQIVHRLSISLSEEENRVTNPVLFLNLAGDTLWQQDKAVSQMQFEHKNGFIGKGYVQPSGKGNKDSLVMNPMDFNGKNRWPLEYAHLLTQWIMFPETQPADKRLNLTASDYQFLRKYMSMLPGESQFPAYPAKAYWPTYVKFLLAGSQPGEWPLPGVRIFNKVGDAYGHLLDAAYIMNEEKNVEFFLSAVLYCNEDGILNDDQYDYDKIGFPFLQALGELIYKYESARMKPNKPDLSRFRFDYTQ